MPSQPPRPIRRGRPPPSAATSKGVPTAATAATQGGIPIKKLIWTGAFAAVTIVGSLYGAGLKTQREYKAERQQFIEATPEERIHALEHRRGVLMSQKIPLEMKLRDLRVRLKAEEAGAEGDVATNVTDGKAK
ncbi:uncharacterized protein BCR38DRAFT_337093 [Pseudomassariella vexata]|uniref:Uncharacterized protein n=1 Tax=Pseudomassariella vexata TaxID=1141098 RepID=A0A1Y2E859_9PEZI|nr:uncharacterized protein BCR38DRAFT_337093 [Pseudomassariella vexata]ORY67466.1 hypothetical protein BCR38DRAFT_337093 [Pseudomassariella vexata]